MKFKMSLLCTTTALLLSASLLFGQAAPAPSSKSGTKPVSRSKSGPLSKADIEKIVRDYILAHPEVLMESVQGHREREQAEGQRRSRDAVASNRRGLYEDTLSPVTGPADATVTIVQFFDYKCGYCRRVLPVLTALLEKHKNVRMIYKELPILGDDSQFAARAALAAEKQGAYLRFHRELMNAGGAITPAVIEDTSKKLGLDAKRLRTDMNSMEVQTALMQNQQLAGAIGVQSTPSFVIGGELISGAMDLPQLEALISKGAHP